MRTQTILFLLVDRVRGKLDCRPYRGRGEGNPKRLVEAASRAFSNRSSFLTLRDAAQPLSTPTCAVFEQHSGTGSSSHQTSSERQAGLPRIPGGSANDSRLRSNPPDTEGASSMGGRR